MKSVVLTFALLVSANVAHAQTFTPTAAQQQNAIQVTNAVGQHLSLDTARLDSPTTLYLGGWALELSSGSQGSIDIIIDRTQSTPGLIYRGERGDVWNAFYYAGFAPQSIPYYSGVNVWLDPSSLSPGVHTVQLVIKNANGVQLASNALGFVK